jgi:hypothetical protein
MAVGKKGGGAKDRRRQRYKRWRNEKWNGRYKKKLRKNGK